MPRLFTLDEASELLPRLQDLLIEMQEEKRTLERLHEQIAVLTGRASGNGHLVAKDLSEKRQEADALQKQLSAQLEEISSMGCELKGIDEGLIDFPSEREGRVVYLCWKLGEERIEHWHDVESGFAGRERL
jgi:hypothetical protein